MSTTPQQGATGPPPKPWERSGSSSGPAPFRPPSAGATSEVVEASGTARPGEIVSTSDRTTAVNTNAVGRPLPTRPWENTVGTSNIGGYNSGLAYNSGGLGSGMYNSYGGGYGGMSGGMYGGSSMYRGGYGTGSSMYGGGMYGGGMYGGGMYGGSGLGGTMGGLGGMGGMGGMGGYGMGMGGPLGPQDPNNAPAAPPGFWISFLRVMEGVVNFFGRVSLLVDQNTQAVHFFMTALLQLFDRGGMLYGELARFVFRILGRKARKIAPAIGPNGLPLPGPDMQNGQKLLEGPKAASAGAWDNVWGNDGRR